MQNKTKLTQEELLELAEFLYSRYEIKYRKLSLKISPNQKIIKMDSNHDKINK